MEALFESLPMWAQWLTGLAGALIALGVIWRLGVVSLGRALWAAILAAPKIADGIERLGDLIRGDVLEQIAALSTRMVVLETRVQEHQTEAGRRDERISELDAALSLQRQVAEAQGARITAQELAVEALSSQRLPSAT